ncbi:MAG: LytTR family transcriptional regulator DNA-binding domain-containing protein [Chitinispirillaceae bacterium]|nr:LytTR family transcriptional regulator DNA-binding domain-containing protein [Chitinispirillaceae bacterium]
MLRGAEFIRIHRKYIVNRTYISEIRRIGDRKFKVLLKMSVEKELLAGRHYLGNLKYLQ